MSYDIDVWSVDEPDVQICLTGGRRRGGAWIPTEDGWSQLGESWALHCGPPDRIEAEDVPDAVLRRLPRARFVTRLVLEPASAPRAGRVELRRVARALAKSAGGVIHDEREGESGILAALQRRFPLAGPTRVALLSLRWWMQHDALFDRAHSDRLLEILAARLPEALPRRYGLYEPPQHRYDPQRHTRFAAYVHEHIADGLVLYPTHPVVDVQISCTREHHPTQGFRSNLVVLELDASALEQPGREDLVRKLWLEMCDHLSPFYAEVRTLGGHLRVGSRYSRDQHTDTEPVCAWWWKGIPRVLGHAAAVGTPYLAAWPEAVDAGELRGDLAVLDSGSWSAGKTLSLVAPLGLQQPGTPTSVSLPTGGWTTSQVEGHAAVWPFNAGTSDRR